MVVVKGKKGFTPKDPIQCIVQAIPLEVWKHYHPEAGKGDAKYSGKDGSAPGDNETWMSEKTRERMNQIADDPEPKSEVFLNQSHLSKKMQFTENEVNINHIKCNLFLISGCHFNHCYNIDFLQPKSIWNKCKVSIN